jgi:hypothetical protein
MIVDPIVKPPQPEWRQRIDRQFKPNAPVSKAFPSDQRNDDDPDPPPAAPAMRPWPRVFPGL